jgi:(R,R)-butanediol dehydrogenase/meso-butanediol dehydrogenase/diacetyl reductase
LTQWTDGVGPYVDAVRALRFHGREDVRLEDIDEPVAGPGEVLLAVAYNGLCGSDVHEYYAGPAAVTVDPHPLTGCSVPCVLGHELSGWVVGVGEGVADLPIGALVAVEPIETCGRCERCRSNRRHLCRKLAFHGYNRAGGGLADRTVVRRDMVHVLPDGVSALHGALVEPMAVARRAVRRARPRRGELAVVHGAGPIGLGTVIALQAADVPVVVVDPSSGRRSAATLLGAEHVLDPTGADVVALVRELTDGQGAECSIEAAGAESALTAALRSTRPDGTIVLVAHHRAPYPLRSASLIFNEVTLTGSLIYDRSDFRWVLDAMERGEYPLDGWVTEIELDRVVEDGLVPLRAHQANKVVVRIDDEQPL